MYLPEASHKIGLQLQLQSLTDLCVKLTSRQNQIHSQALLHNPVKVDFTGLTQVSTYCPPFAFISVMRAVGTPT